MVPSQAKSLNLKLFIVKCRTSEIVQGLLKQLRFYENVFEMLKDPLEEKQLLHVPEVGRIFIC